MPRHDDDWPRRPQEEDDYRDGPPRKSSSAAPWIIGGLVGGGVLAVALLGCLGYLFWARAAPVAAPGAAPGAAPVVVDVLPGSPKKVYTRDGLKTAVLGKTMDEVRALLGPPDSTSEAAETSWYYKSVSTDPATRKTDGRAQIVFGKEGKVVAVTFDS